MILRYEDLCQTPEEIANSLMSFLNLKHHQKLEKFIRDHAHSDILPNFDNRWLTKRKSSIMAFEWRKHLKEHYISDIQLSCEPSMKLLGYNPMQNIVSDTLNETYPLLCKRNSN